MLIRRALDDSTEIIEDYDFVEPESPKMTALKDKITASMSTLVSGIDRVINFYNSHNSDRPIQNIWITGVGAGFKGFKRLLTNELGAQVQVLDKNSGLQVGQSGEDSIGEYLACFGAAMAPVGFGVTPTKKTASGKIVKERSKEQTYAAYGILVFSLSIFVAIMLLVISTVSYSSALAKYNNSVKQMNQLQVVKGVYDKYQEITGLKVQVDGMYAATENNNGGLNDFIAEMEEKMPKDMVVLSMNGTTNDLTMQMEVNSKEAAAKVVQQFREFESVSDVKITGIQSVLDEETGAESIAFNVVITYAPKTVQ